MNHLTGHLAKMHRSELSNEAEVERLLRMARPGGSRFGDWVFRTIHDHLASSGLRLQGITHAGLHTLKKGAKVLRILTVAALAIGLTMALGTAGLIHTAPDLAKATASEVGGSGQIGLAT